MAKIINVKGRQVFDSRGNPTVEAEVYLDNGISSKAPVDAPDGDIAVAEISLSKKTSASTVGFPLLSKT